MSYITKEKEKAILNYLYSNLVWIMLLTGTILLAGSRLNILSNFNNVCYVFEKMGIAIFSSGVFAAVLKSIQFTGIFKEEIEKIILGTKFVENRSDLPKLWKRISRSVYKKKFPEISDDLQNIILNTYFPTNHKFYYEDFIITINIEELTDDLIIKFTQTLKINVVMAEGETEALMEHDFTVDKFDGIENYINEREFYKIDGEDKLDRILINESEDEFQIKKTFKTSIIGKKTFTLESKDRREYCIKDNNFKIFRVHNITKEMDVSVNYPDNISVSFFNLGVVENFEYKHIEHKNYISRIHKKGLILPYQGFGLTLAKK
jgi:hypothetical protein